MAAIEPVLIVNGTKLVGVNKMSITWRLGAPESMSYTANGQNVGTLTPGVAPGSTRVIGFSLDNATAVDARMLSTGTEADLSDPVVASESGTSIGQALETTHVARLTAQQVRVVDVFNGQRGYVVAQAGYAASALIVPSAVIPTFQGISYTPVGGDPTSALATSLQFSWVVDAAIAALPIDIDVNRDTLIRITQSVSESLGSAVDPQRAQFVVDSGDFGVAGGAKTVSIGHLGASSHLTFSDFASSATTQPILLGTKTQPSTMQMCRSASFIGGDTHHGQPESGRLTGVVTINHTINDATGDYRSGLPILAFYADRDNGGVYFDPGDNVLHPWSQAMGVNDLWYNEDTAPGAVPQVFAATDAGVYVQTADVVATQGQPWTRLGNLGYKVLKVMAIPDIYCLVEVPKTAARVVLKFSPGASANTAWEDWETVWSMDGLADFCVATGDPTAGVDTWLYMLSANAPGYLFSYHVTFPPTDLQLTRTQIPLVGGNQPVGLGLDPLTQYTTSFTGGTFTSGLFLRTDIGASGLFYIKGGSVVLLPSGSGLVDAYGTQVQVNRVRLHSPGIIQWGAAGTIVGQAVALLACTSAGLFVNNDITGQQPWRDTGGQNNLGDIDLADVASAPPRLWAADQYGGTMMLTRFYAINATAYYKSHDGTVHWIDVFNQVLDAGPAFFALYKAASAGDSYPGNDLASTVVSVLSGSGAAWLVQRGLNAIGAFDYVVVNPTSAAPAGAHRDAELSHISAPALSPVIPLSQLLIDAMIRFLWYTSRPQTILRISSVFDDTTDPLRTLRPTHRVAVSGTISEQIVGLNGAAPITFVTYSGLLCYVLDHTITYDADQDATSCTTQTTLGVLCLDDRTDPQKVTSDLYFQLSRQQMYRTRGHH